MIRTRPQWLAAVALLLGNFAGMASGQEKKLPSAANILDPDVIFYHRPDPVISPNGEWVAYVSKGFVTICNVHDPAPRQLFEVPDSWTHVLARPEHRHAQGDYDSLVRLLGKDQYKKLGSEITEHVYGLEWTHNSDAVVFCVQSYGKDDEEPAYVNRLVSLDGVVTVLSSVGPDVVTTAITVATLTRDRRFLVAKGFKRSLIWNVATNKPRATCFSNLTPSPTSGRWIGVEKDTRQLVITNDDFQVTKRFDEYGPTWPFGFLGLKLNWSPDERFIIWRNQVGFDYYSNWEGFWMNLDTGAKRELSGRFMDEYIAFTGRGGEFVRCGREEDGLATRLPAHLSIFPEGDAPPQDVWRISIDTSRGHQGPGAIPVLPGPECELFALGLPRATGHHYRSIWHLMDRRGNKWRFPGEDNGDNHSPYQLVGFAENGKMFIAHNHQRLFSLPLSAIQAAKNKVD